MISLKVSKVILIVIGYMDIYSVTTTNRQPSDSQKGENP